MASGTALSELPYASEFVMMSETIEGLRNKLFCWKELLISRI